MSNKQIHYKNTLDYFENVAQQDGGIYDKENGIAMGVQAQVRQALIDMISEPVDSLLDAGCGRGDFTNVLANKYPKKKIVGIDFSQSMVDVAAAQYGSSKVEFMQSLLTDIKLPDNSIDTVICLNVLHHLQPQDFSLAMKELCRIARCQVLIEYKNSFSPYHIIKKIVVPKSIGAQIYGTNILRVKEIAKECHCQVSKTWSFLSTGVYLSPIVCVSIRVSGGVSQNQEDEL